MDGPAYVGTPEPRVNPLVAIVRSELARGRIARGMCWCAAGETQQRDTVRPADIKFTQDQQIERRHPPLEAALTAFFEKCLKPGMCWNPQGGVFDPEAGQCPDWKLIYQDGTASRADSVCCDVYQARDLSIVFSERCGYDFDEFLIEHWFTCTVCATPLELYACLWLNGGCDPNTSQELLLKIGEEKLPKFATESDSQLMILADKINNFLAKVKHCERGRFIF